jgi:hypothetical protein
MAEKRFVWMLDPQEASINGRRLETGQSYAATDFGEAVVEEWVRTGAAKYSKPGKDKPGLEE